MPAMTAMQQSCLDIIRGINAAEFGGWFRPSWCMATIQIESAFRPRATRFEPRLSEASYGLGQVLASTARSLGLAGAPDQMFDPEVGIRYMMRCHRRDFDVLTRRFGRAPTLEEWADAYNRGAGGAELGDPDHAYVALWDRAQEFWAFADEAAPAQQPAEHSPPGTEAVHPVPVPASPAPPDPPAGDDGDTEADRLNAEELKGIS